ncbi:ribosome assembly RNA-binding protein YhbY [Paenibacillus urinalis]|uniref:Ribosome assembly RNA-binding protein YhbY n=1 Tax=Paenibacillus urinalis TaxID=521520 RepID=A0AAX3MWX3_9BACL|nr:MULTISPECIES: ribosome assembly RNA-binding protein YhbY [Paenibacillus]OMC69065.1 RNA-binding protein [Paenibacillus sp. FSL H7-0326]WDH81631.1 ribosome assembly RNA-binding protein YhbY [Paenibacillus urinalis]WDH97674.1 ribosome assembly RNA-binding protein YhbY [Paenibacillus urinalis]WDI01349.1 ribosome assembly RNA-binding protein YhbY [Paenibacillus urinalis]SDX06114.1 RNA-binding protein [Paenibacillus sp. PDC88]
MTLTGKQKRYLRSQAHHLDPVFQIGKGGTNEHLFRHIEEAIEKRELMKISILNNNLDDKHEIAEELAERTGSEIVQIIGNTITLYKESRDNKQIVLP